MKYMTPELLARVRSDDDAVAEAAAEEWERRGEEYRTRLTEIGSRTRLPGCVRSKLLKRDYLHDAKVLTMAADTGNRFSIFLELAGVLDPAHKHIELQYRLVGGPGKGREFLEHPALAGDGRPLGWWLYDELDVTDGQVEAFTHSILFTGGWEMQLTFFAFQWKRLDFLFPPTNSEGVADPMEAESLRRMRRALGACS
jgi:hypothetical protein